MQAKFIKDYYLVEKADPYCEQDMLGCNSKDIVWDYKVGDGIIGNISQNNSTFDINTPRGLWKIPIEYFDISQGMKTTFLQKHKNHLIIAGAIVLAFLAYKKFK
jgi:hypothetical protein